MANSGPDTNGSQFFITDGPQRELDFRYTIFGFMTEGGSILQQIENVPVHAQSSTNTEVSAPNNTVTMTSVTTFTDTQNGVLQLSAPAGTTGTATVTVTAIDGVTGDSTTQTFQVTVGADSTVDPPFLNRPTSGIPPIQTGSNTPVSFSIPGLDVNGNAINYTATVQPANSNLAVTVNSATGQATLTPSNGVSGVFSIEEGVSASSTAIRRSITKWCPSMSTPPRPAASSFSPATAAQQSHRSQQFDGQAPSVPGERRGLRRDRPVVGRWHGDSHHRAIANRHLRGPRQRLPAARLWPTGVTRSPPRRPCRSRTSPWAMKAIAPAWPAWSRRR